MRIDPIQLTMPSLTPVSPAATPGPHAGAGAMLNGFGQALDDAITTLDGLQKDSDQLGTKLAAGEPVDLHDVMLAQERASMGFQLAVQVRNKLVEAYTDVMRTQV